VYRTLKQTVEIFKDSAAFSAPSNIALVKYWGKYPVQLPANPSISFTLEHCKTETSLEIERSTSELKNFSVDVFVGGKEKTDFKPKIIKFLERIEPYFSFLKTYHFTIKTHNTFPHSSGIASSASGFAALASCLVHIEHKLAQDNSFDSSKASFIARLGSGSAARSISGPMMVWGKHQKIKDSNDETAVVFEDVNDVFKDYQDVILLVDKGQKQVSSTVGHNLMNDHPFAKNRFKQAENHLSELLTVLKNGDLSRFIEITESEALSLHAMMMCSQPYYILMKPQTLQIIEHIWNFRNSTGIPVSFTLDAGANVHVLFPKSHKTKVLELINTELIGFCQNEQYICDNIGIGIKPLL
jgi:diphosphomevalonate decarboxylase